MQNLTQIRIKYLLFYALTTGSTKKHFDFYSFKLHKYVNKTIKKRLNRRQIDTHLH